LLWSRDVAPLLIRVTECAWEIVTVRGAVGTRWYDICNKKKVNQNVSVKANAPTIHCYSLRKYSHKVINDDRLVGVFDFSSNMCLLPPVSSRSPEGS
jgi:hypothetical protein